MKRQSIKTRNKKSGMPKLNASEELIYIEEKYQMTNEIVKFISNYHSKIKPSDFNLDVLNAWYLTNGDLKLIEDLLNSGLTEEEVKEFISETCPQQVINQYVDREEIIKKNRDRSLYLRRKFKKIIKED